MTEPVFGRFRLILKDKKTEMKLHIAVTLAGALLLNFIALAQSASPVADPLWEVFQNPPGEARASCYWWWKGDLTADEMGRQLHLLKEAGLGGAHIIPWPSGKPAYLSPEWLKLLRAAADAAHKEGMILDMSANAGWPFRGTWVTTAESLHKVEVQTFHLTGPTNFSLPEKSAANTKDSKAKKTESSVDGGILLAQLAAATVAGIEEMRDVTAEFNRKDSPGVAVPAGQHTLRIVRLLKEVKTKDDLGRVPDHFNAPAMENYLKGFAERVAPALDGKLSNGLRALYCDSIEINSANWTPDLPAEFQRRHGYDLMPYLPLVLDVDPSDARPVPGARPLDQTIARVRYDYCRTVSDLFLDGLARPFYRWCHENGVLCRWQAYGWPWFYGIEDGYRIPDMPEGNSWLFADEAFEGVTDLHGWPIWQKYASSGGHQAGRRIVSTEAMTVVGGKFKETLDLVKRTDDFDFVSGINHSFLHGFCYSPANEPFPGRNQYGTYFSEQNPWWPYMRRWMDYNARLNAVFQDSKPVAQVALFYGVSDIWGSTGLDRRPYQNDPPWAHQVWRWISQNGANADYVSDQVLQQSSFDAGKINFGPMHYEALIVLGAKTLVPATAEALERYVRAGGKIVFVGELPDSSPGFKDAAANDRKVRETVQNLLRDFPQTVGRRDFPGKVPAATKPVPWKDWLSQWRKTTTPEKCLAWADKLLTDLRVPRSVQLAKPVTGLYQIHYRHADGRNLYFFANTAESDLTVSAAFPQAEKHLERWNPETGTRTAFPVDKNGRAFVVLPPGGSLLLVASLGEALVESAAPRPSRREVIQKIAGPWAVDFQPANKKSAAFQIASFPLAGLEQSPEERLNRFAGQMIYRTRFNWDASTGNVGRLDLGEVASCISEVTLNGKSLGTCWYGRHDYDVAGALQPGENQLEVKLVSNLFNCVRKTTEKPVPTGLIGPVTLRTTMEVAVKN